MIATLTNEGRNESTAPSTWKAALDKEMSLTYKILKGNAFAHIGFGTLLTIANLISIQANSPLVILGSMFKSFTWFFGYGYFFDICDQIQGHEGDAINADVIQTKKGRPLSTGEMTIESAQCRQIVSCVYFLLISALYGGLPLLLCAIAWSCISVNYEKLGNHFATKNYFSMTVGSFAMLAAGRILTGRDLVHLPSLLVSFWFGYSVDMQDFRDEKGDRCAGRQTLIIVLGERRAKMVWAAMISLTSFLLCQILTKTESNFQFNSEVMFFGPLFVGLMGQTIKSKTARQYDSSYLTFLLLTIALKCRSAFW